MKVLFIYNPQSGVKNMEVKNEIMEYIDSSTHECILFESKPGYGAFEYLMDTQEKYDVIVSMGGDGTISKTVDGMMKAGIDAKLVVVPQGSTNEYAQSLGVDFTSLQDSFSLIDNGVVKEVDVGKINDKYFVYVTGFGNFTSVSYETPQKWKNVLGHFAYWIYGAFKLRVLRNYEYSVIADGETFHDNYLFGLISNAYQFGRVFKYDESEVSLDDGYFEVILVKRPKSAKRFIKILKGMLVHDYSDDMFVLLKVKSLKMESKKHHSWNLDGEFGGKHDLVEIEVLEKKLKVLI